MLHGILEQIADKFPDEMAVQFEKEKPLTFQELDQRCNQFAHYFRAKGIKTQESVIVHLNRSVEQLVVLFALSKIGAIYVPISTEQPPIRLLQIQKDCMSQHIITTKDMLGVTFHESTPMGMSSILLDVERDELERQPLVRPHLEKIKDPIANVAFSSGTTGEPKGIPVEHAGYWHWVREIRRNVDHPVTRVLANTSTDFDAHIWDYIIALAFRAIICITGEATRKDVDKLAQYIIDHRISDMTLTPAILRAFTDEQIQAFAASGLKAIYSTGEACTPDILGRYSKFKIKIYNCYGPTEATFGLSMLLCRLEDLEQGLAPIGIPAPDTGVEVEIVDESGKKVPEGQSGRLVIKSPYVTKGYLNKKSDKITEEKTQDGRLIRCYQTDDKFFQHNGKLYCSGRINQLSHVKIRGQLVDISGIENILRGYQQKKVADAYVVLRNDLGKDAVLVAYIVNDEPFTVEELRRHCVKSGLIPASIPTYFVRLLKKEIPLTINGKINRDALVTKKIVFSRDTSMPFLSPQNEIQNKLAKIWQKVLGISPELKVSIGVKDPFVYFGGDSIKMMLLKSEIKSEFKVNLSLSVTQIGSLEELTIEKLCTIIFKELWMKKADSSVELIKSGDPSLPPLFLLPPISGESIFTYGKLSQQMKTARRIYVLNSPLLTDPAFPIGKTIPEMAKFYLSLIRKIQPEGSIGLIGWSSGGTLAYAIACLLDASNPAHFVGIIDEPSQAIQHKMSEEMFAHQLVNLIGYFKDNYGFEMKIDTQVLSNLPKEAQIHRLFESLNLSSIEETPRNILNHVKVFLLASLSFKSQVLTKTPLTIFRTEATTEQLGPLLNGHSETLGWAGCAKTYIATCLLEGDHFSIMRSPEQLAEKLDFAIPSVLMVSTQKNQEELDMLRKIDARLSRLERHLSVSKQDLAFPGQGSLSAAPSFFSHKNKKIKKVDTASLRIPFRSKF